MAEEKKDTQAEGKGIPEKKQKKKLKSTLYEIKGDELIRKNKFCVKCGPGVFLAAHKDRLACGKCGYAEKNG